MKNVFKVVFRSHIYLTANQSFNLDFSVLSIYVGEEFLQSAVIVTVYLIHEITTL